MKNVPSKTYTSQKKKNIETKETYTSQKKKNIETKDV
jgi:hypothetical protein